MSKKTLQIYPRQDAMVINLGPMEIWDGADLALLRECLTRFVRVEKRRRVGVDMTFVKYIPSGFFGMLCDYADEGITVRVYNPQPNVQQMLWFARFFEPISDGYQLRLDLCDAPEAPTITTTHAMGQSPMAESWYPTPVAGRK